MNRKQELNSNYNSETLNYNDELLCYENETGI